MKNHWKRYAPAVLAALCVFGRAPVFAAVDSTADFQPMSLAGDWRFAMDPTDTGYNDKWFNNTLNDRIRLPGSLQFQGYGNDISKDTPWVSTTRLGPGWWNSANVSAELRDKYSQPGSTQVPFLSQPIKHYLGVAWYQRDITIPDSWKGRRVVLTLERPHWQTTVWLDDKQYVSNDSLVAPHITDLGMIAPGRHRLTIRIDNRTMLPAEGHVLDAHAISDSLGATWNGIAGKIELSSTTPVWLDDAEVFPDVEKKVATVKVKIGNVSGNVGAGQLYYRVAQYNEPGASQFTLITGLLPSTPVKWDATGGTAEFTIPLSSTTKAWSEFVPALQRLTLVLDGGPTAQDTDELSFGVREITYRDKEMLLNGSPVNLRLTHSGGDFPLTGYPATDVASWKKIFQVCKDYGLNGMRFHSYCPPEEAFTAADELGFYLQPECGMWDPLSPNTQITKMLEDETARMLKAYGNHPSFLLLSPSNEPSGNYEQVTPQWAAAWYKTDPRRLYSAGTGWGRPGQFDGPQYATVVGYGYPNGPRLRGDNVWFDRDYGASLQNIHIPVLAHEIGQWCAYPDFDVIKKFTGYLRPSNYNIFRDLAEEHGLLEWNKVFAWASGRFQLACYKEDIEANLRTPNLAGFQMLDLHDYLGQGTALVGLLDAFWQPKNYVTPAEFRRFNGPTVPLARFPKRNYTSAESLTASVEIYNFAQGPYENAVPYWRVVDKDGRAVAQGQWAAQDIAIGKNIPLGNVSVDLSKLPAPGAYKLVTGLRNTTVENSWNFWVYPAEINNAIPDGVFVTSSWSEAETHLNQGGKVLFIPGNADLNPQTSPPMQRVPIFWNRQMNPRFDAMLGIWCDTANGALAEFPTEQYCDWQWTPLINGVRSINMNSAPKTIRPIVAAIDDWNRNWRLMVMFECRVGNGSLFVCSIPLDRQNTPGLQQLRRSILDYMASERFQPAVADPAITMDDLRGIWASTASAAPAATTAPATAPAAPASVPGAPGPDVDENGRQPATTPSA